MLFDALVRFCTWLAMTLVAALSRLTEAPITPRCAEIAVMAALTAVRAAVELALFDSELVLRLSAVAERAVMVVVICVFDAPDVVPSLMNTVLVLLVPVAAFITPSTASFEVTERPVAPVLGPTCKAPATTVAVVPAESVPAVTADATAVVSVAIVSPLWAVNTNVPPVVASLMVVFEPAVSVVVVARPACVEENVVGLLDANT